MGHLIFQVMSTFIEDYLSNPSLAIAEAKNRPLSWADDVDEDFIYSQISTPQFRLYEAVILAPSTEDLTFEAKSIYL